MILSRRERVGRAMSFDSPDMPPVSRASKTRFGSSDESRHDKGVNRRQTSASVFPLLSLGLAANRTERSPLDPISALAQG